MHINLAALAAHDARAFDKTSDAVDEVNVLKLQAADDKPKTFANSDDTQFRQYETACDRVKNFYLEQHTKQTVAFNVEIRERFERTRGARAKMSVWEALDLLGTLVDESDPDTELTQIEHALQTAEAMRRDGRPEWMQAVGLVHDLGKLLYFFTQLCDPGAQWAVVGDTFPVGCAYSDKIVLKKNTFHANPDKEDERYQSECGIYEKGCGLDNVMMSWGHDEYLYRVVKGHCNIPEEGLAMIRYHSFYPTQVASRRCLHASHAAFRRKLLAAVRSFNPYDLYSKGDGAPKIEELRPYYEQLVARWFPEDLEW
ncbi:myo-inositol oxygenase [Auriculariales sp. MPI-PUGE-AT-0066]|nr:myo-inositol oxygenase [Auriculariales sp. MPI-PUGE-AT-0066]